MFTTTPLSRLPYGAWADRATLTYQPINQDLFGLKEATYGKV